MAEAIGEGRQGVPDHEVRDHRLLAGGHEEQAEERRAACSSRRTRRATSSATWPGCTSRTRAASRSSRPSAARRSRRSTTTSPASRRAPRTRTRRSRRSTRYSQDFVDQAKCKELALNQIARGLAGRLPGRRRVRPRRARRGEGEGRAGHRRRRRPGLPRQPGHDLGAQEGRRGGLRRGQGRPRTARFKARHGHDLRRRSPAASASARRTPWAPSTRPRSPQLEKKISLGRAHRHPDTVK